MNPASIQNLLLKSEKSTSGRESHDSYEARHQSSDEEDEGEIVSDEEDMEEDGKSKPALTIRYVTIVSTKRTPFSFVSCFFYTVFDECRGDEVVQLIANLVCQLKGAEACAAISKIADTHAKIEKYLKTQGRSI